MLIELLVRGRTLGDVAGTFHGALPRMSHEISVFLKDRGDASPAVGTYAGDAATLAEYLADHPELSGHVIVDYCVSKGRTIYRVVPPQADGHDEEPKKKE